MVLTVTLTVKANRSKARITDPCTCLVMKGYDAEDTLHAQKLAFSSHSMQDMYIVTQKSRLLMVA
jgi:hypothetical protein